MVRLIVAALMMVLAGTAGAQAQMDILPEMRAGLFLHDAGGIIETGGFPEGQTYLTDANAELLFSVPDLSAWSLIGELRPHVGATVNLNGGQSLGYAGLSFTAYAPLLPIFAEASVGGAAVGRFDGETFETAGGLACAAAFRGSASVGTNLLLGTSIMLTVEHANDFGLCDERSEAMTNVGVRAGFRF